MYQFELELQGKGYQHIAGCDEVGRGPLAGPVVAAAVILDPSYTIEGLQDSKKCSESKRNMLDKEIKEHALCYAITYIYPEEIDRINIYQSSKKAMIDAIRQLSTQPDYILSDAMPLGDIGIPFIDIIKGDSKSASIAAASIIAKVERDRYMAEMDETYPGYGFKQHKGYPTKKHLEALQKIGVCEIHRKTYKPVQDVLQTQLTLDI